MLTIAGTPPQYYSPYPTLTTMRGQGGLGDATSDQLAAYYRTLAKEYGIKLPARPAGLSEGAAQTWDILEAIEVSSGQLADISNRLFRMLAKGGAMCADLLRYNRLAIGIYESQRGILAELQKDGIGGLPLSPPWPPLFVGFGNYSAAPAESFWKIDCKSPVVTLSTDANPDGVKIMMSRGCETGLAGAVITVIGIITVAGLIYGLVSSALQASVDKTTLREESARTVRNLELLRVLEAIKETRTDKCVAGGGDYQDCLVTADESTAGIKDIDVANQTAKNEIHSTGRSWLWWVGLATVVVGGVVIYKVVKNRPGRQKLPRAEIIEAD